MKLKFLMFAALMAAFLMPFGIYAEDTEQPAETTTEATAEATTAEATTETTEAETLMYKILVVNLGDEGKVVESLSATYELKSQLGIRDAVKYHVDKIVKPSDYVIAKDYLGRDHIEMGACEAVVYVHPKVKAVQVIHHLYGCDGKAKHVFLETVEMPYLQGLTEKNAPEIVQGLIKGVSGSGYKLKDLKVKDHEPVEYKVYDMDGKEITPEPEMATIYLYYIDERCEETTKAEAEIEQQVDGAKAEVQSLPATGSSDIVAFLMSATALLGLGIFFAKKH